MPRKFDVIVSPVREVSLLGRADLRYWQERLKVHRLHPTEVDGRAEMMLSSCEARFRGVRFREFLAAVFVTAKPGRRDRDGVLLLRAFNSLRFFAWVERTMFRTPYYPGRVSLSPEFPAFMRLGDEATPIVEVAMSAANDRTLPAASPDGWEGPIFLPDLNDDAVESARLFYGSLTGDTHTMSFDPIRDVFRLGNSQSDPVVSPLVESGFEPHEWILRAAGRHGKSKTIRRVAGEEFAGFANGRQLS